MSKLHELRSRLDQIDAKIAKLYERRMEVCAEIGRCKALSGESILNQKREEEKLREVEAEVKDPKNKKGVRLLFEFLLLQSRQLQENISKKWKVEEQPRKT